jgi:GAF domain-containing protein
MATMLTQGDRGADGRAVEAVISGRLTGLGTSATPRPDLESERLEELIRYGILDTAPEDAFDELTRLAAAVCAAPIAMVSLVDAGRQWFKSKLGLSLEETRRDLTFCAHAILQDGLFVVPNALVDPRFAGNPLVLAEPFIRFYAGAPLVTPGGRALGTLCIIDRVPRALDADAAEALRALARPVVGRLELCLL